MPRAALPPLPPVPPQRRFLQLTAPPLAALASPENDNTDANSTCSTLTDSGYEFTEEDDDDTVNSAQTHDPEDDENENVELADDTDDEDSTMDGNGFSRFVMKRSSYPALRQLIKNDCIDAALAVQEDGFFFDALGPKVIDVIDRPLSKGSGIYAILNVEHTQYVKIGSTRNFCRRLARNVEAGIHPDRFRRIFDLYVITEELDSRLQDIYRSVLAIMDNNDTLHEFHQYFRELLEERQGERLGPKKQIILQLI